MLVGLSIDLSNMALSLMRNHLARIALAVIIGRKFVSLMTEFPGYGRLASRYGHFEDRHLGPSAQDQVTLKENHTINGNSRTHYRHNNSHFA